MQQKLQAWQDDYNLHRPHGSLGHLTPREYVQKWPVQPKEAAAVKRVGLVLFRRRQKPRRLVGKRRPASLVCPQKGELDE